MSRFQPNVRDPSLKAARETMPLAPVVGSAVAAALTVFIVGATMIKGNAAPERPVTLSFVIPWALAVTSEDARSPDTTIR